MVRTPARHRQSRPAERIGEPAALKRFERFIVAFPHSNRKPVAAEHAARLRARR